MMAAVNALVPIVIIMASMKVVVVLVPMTKKRMRNLITQLPKMIWITVVKMKMICLGIMVKKK